jgi:hypothetical protein
MSEDIVSQDIREGIFNILSYLHDETDVTKAIKSVAQKVNYAPALNAIYKDALSLYESQKAREKAKARMKKK